MGRTRSFCPILIANIMRRALLIGSVALNALLVVVLCSSLLSSNNVGAPAIRATGRTAPIRTARVGRTAVHAKNGMDIEKMKRDFQRTMGAAALSGVAAMHSLPAQALVDKRLNGDGAGIPLGVNDSRLFFILAGVFTTVWALYASSVKGISNNDDDDSGLNLS